MCMLYENIFFTAKQIPSLLLTVLFETLVTQKYYWPYSKDIWYKRKTKLLLKI